MNAAAVLPELDGIFALREEQRTALEAFLEKISLKHSHALQLAIGWWRERRVTPHTSLLAKLAANNPIGLLGTL